MRGVRPRRRPVRVRVMPKGTINQADVPLDEMMSEETYRYAHERYCELALRDTRLTSDEAQEMSDLAGSFLHDVRVSRRLPVIRLCEDCAYQQYARCDHVESPNPSPVFTAKMAKSEPPEWCPLRGAR